MRAHLRTLVLLCLPAIIGAGGGHPAAVLTAEPQVLNQAQPASPQGLDRRLFEPSQGSAVVPGRVESPDGDIRWLDALGTVAVSEDLQPLVAIAHKMRRAQQGLAQSDPGPQTQSFQLEAISDLERILGQAEEQARRSDARSPAEPSQRPNGSATHQKPTAQPGRTPGAARQQAENSKPEKPEPAAIEGLLQQVWGELPQREREQLLQQWRAERFLPKYETLLEAYYRRLAQEKSGRQP